MAGNLSGFGMVGVEILDFTLECGIVLTNKCPIYKVSKLSSLCQEKFILGRDGSVVLPNGVSIERMGMDSTATTISGKKFGEGGVEVIGNEGGDNVLFTVGDNKKVVGTHSVKVVLPSRTRENTRLGTVRTWSMPLNISFHGFGFQCVSLGLLV